jgi:cytochrome P450
VDALGGWLVTGRALAVEVMRDAATFTVDDPRFTTAQVVGPSMLSLDGPEHARHRDPFVEPFRPRVVHAALGEAVRREADRLIDALAPRGAAELRRDFAGPLAAAVMAEVLGLADIPVTTVLAWYDAIVRAVDLLTHGEAAGTEGPAAYRALRDAVAGTLDAGANGSLLARAAADGRLDRAELASNAAVLLFGGIETTEATIANALLHVLTHDDERRRLEADPVLVANAVEESMRLEPAAAVVDRYATRDVVLGTAPVRERDLVRVSLSAANRDPAVFADPDRFDVGRQNAKLQVSFAHGPHVCLGMHLARLEAHVALRRALERLPGLRLDPARPAAVTGLVFRKPAVLHALWDVPPAGSLSP